MSLRKRAFRFAPASAICVAVLSLLALGLRTLDIPPPELPFLYPMSRTTAWTLLAVSLGYCALLLGRLAVARLSAVLVLAFATAALIAHALRTNALIRDVPLLVQEFALAVTTAFPNVICFYLIGFALYTTAGIQVTVGRLVMACLAGILVTTIGTSALLDGVLQIFPVSGAFEGEMPADSALSAVLAGLIITRVAYVLLRSNVERPPLTLPIGVAIIGTLVSFVTWRLLLQERTYDVAAHSSDTATAIARTLSTELRGRIQALRSAFIPYVRDDSGNITWLAFALDGTVTTSEPQSLDPATLDLLYRAREHNDSVVAVLPPTNRRAAVLIAVPEYSGSRFRGFRVASLSLRELLEPFANDILGPNYQLFFHHPNGTTYVLPDPPIPHERSPEAELHSGALGGVVQVLPASIYVRRGATWASHVALTMGIAASFLLALSIHLVTVSQERLALVQSARLGLEKQIEERKKAERELEKQAGLLESSNADLREFAYVTSHDLQEPLRTITSFATMLSRRYKGRLDNDADEFLDFITDGATRMSGMIQALLIYSRVVNATAVTETVPIAEAVEWAERNLATAIEESSARVSYDSLPSVRGNRVQLGQLFQNLLGNAIKYRSDRAPVIQIGCRRENAYYLFSVADNGIGIAPEHRERIFGLFKRLHGHQYPGTGIGLAICKRIVQRHGGRIWMDSVPGVGSTVFFTVLADQADR